MRIRTLVSSIVFLVLAGCASTAFKSTWKNPQAQPVPLAGKKVLVVVTNVPTAVRTTMEAAVADELTKNGAIAMPSRQFLGPDATKEEAKAKLSAEDYDAAWVIRMTNREQEISSTPSMYAPAGPYMSYYGWGGGYGYGGGSEIRTDTKVYMETLVYSVKHDQLAWSGMSVTTNPGDLTAAAGELTRVALAEMQKSGLLQPAAKP
jgi:hypothetical protein